MGWGKPATTRKREKPFGPFALLGEYGTAIEKAIFERTYRKALTDLAGQYRQKRRLTNWL